VERWEGQCFINVINNLGKTALHEAAQNCFHGTVQYLLERGVSDSYSVNL
jgi:ankyrin repeat protein